MPASLKRDLETNRREHILQRAAAAPVHVHVAGGDPRQAERLAERLQEFQAARIEAAGQELDTDPETPGKALAQPAAVAFVARQSRPSGLGQPENQASVEGILEILTLEPIAALGARAPCPADQTAERAVGCPIGGERHELERVGRRRPDGDRNEIPRRR